MSPTSCPQTIIDGIDLGFLIQDFLITDLHFVLVMMMIFVRAKDIHRMTIALKEIQEGSLNNLDLRQMKYFLLIQRYRGFRPPHSLDPDWRRDDRFRRDREMDRRDFRVNYRGFYIFNLALPEILAFILESFILVQEMIIEKGMIAVIIAINLLMVLV